MDLSSLKPGMLLVVRPTYWGQQQQYPVRVEKKNPDGTWVSRSLTTAKKVKIENSSQILDTLTPEEVVGIAQGVLPKRRVVQGDRVATDSREAMPGQQLGREPQRRSKEKGAVIRKPSKRKPTPAPLTKAGQGKKAVRVVTIYTRLTILEAAQQVLLEERRPMTTREMIAVAEEKGYWKSAKGATPWATLTGAIRRELETEGDKSRFVQSERGKYVAR